MWDGKSAYEIQDWTRPCLLKKTKLYLQPLFNGPKWDVIRYFPSTWGCKKWHFLPSNYGATSLKTKFYGNHGNPVTMITYMWLHHPLSHNTQHKHIIYKKCGHRSWGKSWKFGLSGISTNIRNAHLLNARQGCYCCTNLLGNTHYDAVLFNISVSVWIWVSNFANFLF